MVAACRNVDVPGPRPPRDAVFDRVFDQGLQQQGRHEHVARVGVDVEADDEAIGKAHTLDVEVLAEELELGVERHFLLAEPLEGQAKEVAEAHQRAVGCVNIAVHERRDGVQRVEEKVRVQLLLERFELRFHELRFQLGRP